MLREQEQILRDGLEEYEKKLSIVENIKRELKVTLNFSVESIGDIAHIMKVKDKLKRGMPLYEVETTEVVGDAPDNIEILNFICYFNKSIKP